MSALKAFVKTVLTLYFTVWGTRWVNVAAAAAGAHAQSPWFGTLFRSQAFAFFVVAGFSLCSAIAVVDLAADLAMRKKA